MNDIFEDEPPKALLKQKYFCQICARQCIDKDGLKCHTNSVTHKRNLEKVAKNPEEYINRYSKEFEFEYLDILKRMFANKWVSANKVYQEYIEIKDATHLNATKWNNLSQFIKYLFETKKCLIKPMENDTMIMYVDNSFDALKAKKELMKKSKKEKKQATVVVHENENEKIHTKANDTMIQQEVKLEDLKGLSITLNTKALVKPQCKSIANTNESEKIKIKLLNKKRKAEKIISDVVKENETENIENIWIKAGLIVKIKDKNLNNGEFFNKKGQIKSIHSNYVAEVEVLNEGKGIKLKIDQYYLEPVIPKPGSQIQIISGDHIGNVGILNSLNIEKGTVSVTIEPDQILELNLKSICKYQI